MGGGGAHRTKTNGRLGESKRVTFDDKHMNRKIMNTCCDCIGSIPRFVRHFITQLEAIFEFFGIIDSRHVLKCLFFLKKSKFVLVLLLEIGNKGFLQSGNLLLYSRF